MLLINKYIKFAFLVIVLGYLAVLVVLYIYQSKLIFYPTRLNSADKLNIPGSFSEHTMQVSDAVTVHYIIQSVPNPKGVILYFHGNADSLDSWGHVAYELSNKTGYEVWMMDYPGFGKSTAELPSSEKVLIQMGHLFIEKIKQNHPNLPLVLFGRSLGSGIASMLSLTENIKALILETPYTSLREIAKFYFPWVPSFLLNYDLDNMQVKNAVHKFPVLILHGTDDEIIPYALCQKLADHLQNQATLITFDGAKHNTLANEQKYWDHLIDFLK